MISEQELKEFYNKGLLAFEKQNYDYAIEIFSQILSSQYDHLEARHYLHLSLQKKAEGSRLNSRHRHFICSQKLDLSITDAPSCKFDKNIFQGSAS